MKRRSFLVTALAGGGSSMSAAQEEGLKLVINLDAANPAKSRGTLAGGKTFPVGFGRDGYLAAGSSFVGGSSLLGEFEVNAILSRDHFEMTDEKVASSGKSRAWLAENLFSNMSSIDFDGDGEGGEYGAAFIGLEPLHSSARQPFHFGEYKGVFRWYSYALHGTQNEDRVGRKITGGCINVNESTLMHLVAVMQLGDRVGVFSTVPE